MDEYIERKAALQFVFDACAECMDACEEFDGIYADCNQCMLEGVKLKLRDLPAADVRPVVRGKWTDKRTIEHDGEWYCTACGKEITIYMGADRKDRYAYCPNCGTDMRPEPPKEE